MQIAGIRLPVLATILVGAAIALMIGLGIWQLQRAQWKEALLAQYEAAADLPDMAWPAVPDPAAPPLYRKSGLNCLSVTDWRATSGRSAEGQSGWVHIAACSIGAEGPGAQVVAGWSERPVSPDWQGGAVSGTIAPDSRNVIRLVADPPVGGLQAVQPPSLDDIPNNHMAYAVQWFVFALIAAVIYVLALSGRKKKSP
jgi:surfeit locus 1 family protein